MTEAPTRPSARQVQLLDAAYEYVLEHGLTDLSLRPLAAAIGSSPRVLMFLFGNKDGLVRALLARARVEELALIEQLDRDRPTASSGLAEATELVWSWLRASGHRRLLRLWVEAYARSVVEPDGAWAGFASTTVDDWLGVLARCQPEAERDSAEGAARRTLALAVLRGCLLDLVASGDEARVDAAMADHLSRAGT
ncbi:TetR family transcriptional regulator [Nocardioides sp. MAH-18]|uniref:TetR family transcriptional regulator n=1 Tax=Nocardioides agri TaxID=2682843 RepID=A0A6L6XSV4_9ACTN|nr:MULTISPECIES: TetR/AcrR family transcriptional regulator [unclassified Nocardioides]MBA2955237.1 TetR/AcrR family transcriptional regulator [Nocardioides sp. CGMCC 1.13656]MVQ50088.1 TetR family transcriptional regulator [Nocardioides sp. MAH-18]